MSWRDTIFEKAAQSRQSLGTITLRKYIIFSVLFSIVFHVLRTFGYISMEFVFHQHPNVVTCSTCSMRYKNEQNHNERIPNIIHQIYFPVRSLDPPEELLAARNSWIEKHPKYTHYLWNESTVQEFIRKEYPHLLTMYESYTYWVWRVNIARYLILYHYGGWYMDLDLICLKSVDDLVDRAEKQKKSVIQHLTFPVGTSNDFFGVTKGHQFLKSVLDFLPQSNRQFIFPYPNTVLRTGTTYMWGRYLNYPYQEEFMILTEKEIAPYFINEHASTWHGWDAHIIRYVIHHLRTFVFIFCFLTVGVVFLFYSKVYILDRINMLVRRYKESNNNNVKYSKV
ncbi:hypothetical protein ACF0H5_010367 [Mactra antiquata]